MFERSEFGAGQFFSAPIISFMACLLKWTRQHLDHMHVAPLERGRHAFSSPGCTPLLGVYMLFERTLRRCRV